MQVIVMIFFLFGLPAGCSMPQKVVDHEEIVWQSNRRLVWDDFTSRAGSSGVFKAYTTAGMRYEIDSPGEQVRIRTEAYFIKSESWVHIDHKNAVLLRHEQGHFDLAAVYARRLDKSLRKFEVSASEFIAQNLNVSVQQIFNELYDELSSTQGRYDAETNHGTIAEAQSEWEVWIKNELVK